MYDHGHGVKQDYGEAVRWYRKATEQGYASAQSNLGVMYANGNGVKQDNGEAVRWCRKAADQGCVNAAEHLKRIIAAGVASVEEERPATSHISTTRVCSNCGIAEGSGGIALKPCSRCKAVVYCGRACQAQHWKKPGGHKPVCCK